MAKVIKGVFPKSDRTIKNSEEKPVPSYVLHISIEFSDPLIWRRIQVPGSYTLAQLHDVIQKAMGWTDSHVHQFVVGKISYEPTLKSNTPRASKRFDEHLYKLHTIEEGMQFMFSYLYDAGEGWEHQLQLEETVPPARELKQPILLSGERACPPEEVGDIHEYNRLVAGSDNGDDDARDTLAELSDRQDFAPETFDIETAKEQVRTV